MRPSYAATDGSETEQVITHVGAGIEANAVDGDELQRRTYPDAGVARLAGALVGFPSGQRGRAVNPLAQPSQVRILPPPSQDTG